MPGKIMLTPASVLEMQLLQIQLPRWGKNYLNLYELIPLASLHPKHSPNVRECISQRVGGWVKE